MADKPNSPFATTNQKSIFVLCFDGTGNKFSGTEADSNILKLYRMLDRNNANVYTFYQPGIGTYITSHTMQTTTALGRVRSWYMKAKDSAIGSSFAEHVMGGYKFLMRYYTCEDDLYFFGFSRGAYTARFLAEMVDHIGLLSAGNEELIRFAWKTYAKWASRRNDGSEAAKEEESELYEFMCGFRETFSRPVRRIRFLGLFDTVNSVPKFESAWMQRSKFPYTARSSAKIIRHAVSIDERRAKFRQDLISGDQTQREDKMNSNTQRYEPGLANGGFDPSGANAHEQQVNRMDKMGMHEEALEDDGFVGDPEKHGDVNTRSKDHHLELAKGAPFKHKLHDGLAGPENDPNTADIHHHNRLTNRAGAMGLDIEKKLRQKLRRRRYSDLNKTQDIEEVWFAGGHADIGGGWTKTEGERWMLSHVPLVWMVNEASKAGLEFDAAKVSRHNCHPDSVDDWGERHSCEESSRNFHSALDDSSSTGLIHDCLTNGEGLPRGTVALWKLMEYLPFRRMDLQPDGSWKAIRWPLPMGEPRDIPLNAQIHHSVIKRMQCNTDYRPGNLIIGGGGRGIRRAPEKYGMGDWTKHKNPDDPIIGTYVRANQYLHG